MKNPKGGELFITRIFSDKYIKVLSVVIEEGASEGSGIFFFILWLR